MKSLIRKLRNVTRSSKARTEVVLAFIEIAHAEWPARGCQEGPDRLCSRGDRACPCPPAPDLF